MNYEQIDAALQREIKIVENDPSLDHMEKAEIIERLEREARECLRQ